MKQSKVKSCLFNLDDNTHGVRNTNEEVVEEANERLINFTFFITPSFGSWFEAKQMCEEQGGNLISESLKPKWELKRLVLNLVFSKPLVKV